MGRIHQFHFLSLLFICHLAFGQTNQAKDSIMYEVSIKNAFSRGLKIQKSINIGIEYNELPYTISNDHQFFLSDLELEGDVTYNNISYKNVDLQYDLVRDEVITENFSGRKIILIKEKVSDFTIEGHAFMKLTDSNSNLKISGYYEILVNDEEVKLLAKRMKRIKGQLANQLSYRKLELHMEYNIRYFLIKDRNYFQVKNNKEIAKILMSGQKKTKIESKGMTREASMIAMVNLYTSLRK